MPGTSIREVHAQGWDRLFNLVKQRNDLLRQLYQVSSAAMDLTPASGLVGEVDTETIRAIADEIDELTPQIDVAIEQHNAAARQIGKPEVRWQKVSLN